MTTAKPCPICAKPGIFEFRPFCSKRCADIDLGRWLNESYAIPARPELEEEGEEEAVPPESATILPFPKGGGRA